MITSLGTKVRAIFETSKERLVREFNESFTLTHSVGTLKLSFRDTGILDNVLEVHLVFTDDADDNHKPFTVNLAVKDDGNLFVYTFYQWYGLGVETQAPFQLSDNEKKRTWSIKVKTTADKEPPRRAVDVTIWRIL